MTNHYEQPPHYEETAPFWNITPTVWAQAHERLHKITDPSHQEHFIKTSSGRPLVAREYAAWLALYRAGGNDAIHYRDYDLPILPSFESGSPKPYWLPTKRFDNYPPTSRWNPINLIVIRPLVIDALPPRPYPDLETDTWEGFVGGRVLVAQQTPQRFRPSHYQASYFSTEPVETFGDVEKILASQSDPVRFGQHVINSLARECRSSSPL